MKAPDIVFLNDKTVSLGCREKRCDIFNTEFRRVRELTDEECDELYNELWRPVLMGKDTRQIIRQWHAKLNRVAG